MTLFRTTVDASPLPLFFSLFLFVIYPSVGGQVSGPITLGSSSRIHTSVPFLTIAPDAVSSSSGEAGVASQPDVHAQHWNAARYAFLNHRAGLAVTLTPWQRNLVPGKFLLYTSGYFRINERNGISGSLRYFSLGTINFSSTPGGPIIHSYHPREYAIDAGYTRKLSERLASAILIRYIHSDLTANNYTPGGDETFPGRSLAMDLGLYYQKNFQAAERSAHWAWGVNLSNLGTPVSYTKDAEKTPIPSNLRIGTRFSLEINESNKISVMTDLNKLLVPTPPVIDYDSVTGEAVIIRGKPRPRLVPLGMIQSFYDAPGILREDGSYSVLAEELHEITLSLGAEYRYKGWLAVRSGYFHEHATKRNRKYFTAGAGFSLGILAVDVSYLVPVNGQNSPYQHTFRVTLSSTFGNI
jgi:hypothetical protein